MNKVTKNIMVSILIFTLGVTLIGCNSKKEIPSIRGKITMVNRNDSNLSILVEDDGIKKYDYDKASITITENTKVFVGNKKVKINDIQEGQIVEVTFTGAVRESYPVQADAKTVTIIE